MMLAILHLYTLLFHFVFPVQWILDKLLSSTHLFITFYMNVNVLIYSSNYLAL